MNSKLVIVVPCYNEEEVIEESALQLKNVLKRLISKNMISIDSKIMFIDDGSKDRTWEKIEILKDKDNIFNGLKLSKNVGHQNALLAGLMVARKNSDCVISIDADLQDDVNKIEDFINEYHKGYDIVYGVRDSRETDTFFKKNTALCFYKLMNFMGINVVYNHADYRLMSKRVIDELENFREINLFLRGLIPLIGFSSTIVYYDRNKRFAGESKYPLKKMLSFAFEGITSFSIKPIRVISIIGGVISIFSIFALVYALISKFNGNVVEGWTSLILSIWLLGGIQLIALGLVGEYIGKIYTEVKRRPRFVIDKILE